MDRDELKEKIAGWLYESSQSIIHEILNYDHCYDSAGSLINFLAPELEKAKKWDKVKKILNKKWPAYHMIEAIDAVEGEKDAPH